MSSLSGSLYLRSLSWMKIWLSVYSSDSSVFSLLSPFSSHSQTVMQCHPILASCFCSSRSLSLLREIFLSQNSVFVFGILKYLHPSCPCQKHPFTKMHVWYLRNTMSGCPGSLGLFTLYLNPLLHKYFRTTISGFVSLLLTAAIFLCRCSMVKWSDIGKIAFSKASLNLPIISCITIQASHILYPLPY